MFRILAVVIVFLGIAHGSRAQMSAAEDSLLLAVDFTDHTYDPRKPGFMFVGSHFLVRYNPLSLALGGLLYVYQKAISPQLQSHCPYEISCSAFSKVCIEEFGIVKGIALTADRLTRCTQFTVIDILPSQLNERTTQIIDPPHKYKVKPHVH